MVSMVDDKEKFEKIIKSCLLEINSLKSDLIKVQNENNFLKDDKNIDTFKNIIKNKEDEISELKNLLNESKKIISDKQSIVNEKNSKIQELMDFQSSVNEIRDGLKNDINQFKSDELEKSHFDLKETLSINLEKDKLINEYLNEIEEYKSKISKLEDNSYYEKFLDIQKELESKNKIIEELKSNSNNENMNESIKNELNSKIIEIDNLSSEINESKEIINSYKIEINQHKELINQYETEINDYKFKIKEYDSEMDNYKADSNINKELNSKIKELHAFINMKNIELGEIKDKITSYEDKINFLKEEVEGSNNIISQKDKEIIALEKQVAITENKLEFSKKDAESLKNSLYEKEKVIKTLENNLNIKESSLNNLQTELKNREIFINTLETKVSENKNELKDLEENMDYREKFNELSTQLKEQNDKIERLKHLKTLVKDFDMDYKNNNE
ncbi:MAG: hypothetical protein LBT66_08735 [Methanobrevibacter sp.]|jgi:chromosome segregation ATPase|nr:hypothetical protein [Candidatus Methanovirga meridionalis]